MKIFSEEGFTLVELMIAMVVTAIVSMALYSVYSVQQRHYTAQNQVTLMQQNLRAAGDMLARDLRITGYNPNESGGFGLEDIRRYSLSGTAQTPTLAVNGNRVIQFTADLDEDGVLDTNETITYSLFNYPVTVAAEQDGILDLARNVGGGRQLVAESIEAFGVAYAFDTNNNGLDLSPNGNVIWAVDSNNDNKLDKALDTNDDGVIDTDDTAGGGAIPGGVNPELANIRATRIWVLAQAEHPDSNFSNQTTYVVAEKQITANDKVRRRLFECTFYLRNLGI